MDTIFMIWITGKTKRKRSKANKFHTQDDMITFAPFYASCMLWTVFICPFVGNKKKRKSKLRDTRYFFSPSLKGRNTKLCIN